MNVQYRTGFASRGTTVYQEQVLRGGERAFGSFASPFDRTCDAEHECEFPACPIAEVAKNESPKDASGESSAENQERKRESLRRSQFRKEDRRKSTGCCVAEIVDFD